MCLLGRASRRLHQNGTHGLAVLPITVSRQNLAASLGRVACMAECRGDEDRTASPPAQLLGSGRFRGERDHVRGDDRKRGTALDATGIRAAGGR